MATFPPRFLLQEDVLINEQWVTFSSSFYIVSFQFIQKALQYSSK